MTAVPQRFDHAPQISWVSWSELPWLSRSHSQAGLVHFCDSVAARAQSATDDVELLKQSLTDAGAELAAEWAGVFERGDRWGIRQAHGRSAPEPLPVEHLADVLDRGAGCSVPPRRDDPRTLLLAPLDDTGVVGFAGRSISAAQLSTVVAMAHVLERGLALVRQRMQAARRLDRSRITLEIARRFAQERETQPLLERMAEEATRLFDCDRASIFIWDRAAKQLVACPALGVRGGELWLPDNKGIVGQVVQTGETLRVDDAYGDNRFERSIDKSSGYRTRNLLCAPLYNAAGERIGAFELINKRGGPFTADDEEGLREFGLQAALAIQYARERDVLVRSNVQLKAQVTGSAAIIGESPAIVALRDTISRLAATDLPVLILGESGTGKEVAAQALHYQGPRADRPFIPVNCAALTETLLESELFGHEKGAFTDAHAMQKGKFELAEGGTLFLDEIGDMSLGGQAKLLRVLEHKVVTRVGGSQTIPINVRVIAATNADLAERVAQKRFRQDLFYRLSVVSLEIPPLRERPEDVLPLAEFFLERFCRQANRKPLELAPEARRRLQAHHWPGNVRELRNLMERVAFLTREPRVEAQDIAFILSPQRDAFDDLADGVGLTDATNRFQQEYIRRAVKRVRGNMSDAARVLGLHRSNLYRKMRQLGMEVVDKTEP
ncbi:MAG: sigma-54-dependent Fis family transcriptional regulator [Planctomycetaceae bacterium]